MCLRFDSRGPSALLLAGIVALLTFVSACGDGGDGGPTAQPASTPTPTAPRDEPAGEPPEPETAAPRVAWTRATLIRNLRGRRIRVEGERVRIDPDTLTCGGVGPPARRVGGEPAWTRHRCLQPTFPAGALVGPDAIFVVVPTGARSFETTEAEFPDY